MPRSMRVGMVSDTHGLLDPRVLRALRGCDVIVHAGDVGGDGVLEELEGAGARVIAVRGNNDVPGKWRAGITPRLHTLADEACLMTPGGAVQVLHGHRVLPATARHHKLRERFPDACLVVYGHSHRQCVDRSARPWVANPGAAGRARTFGGPGLLLLDCTARACRMDALRFAPRA